ncbi:bacteriocin [Chryseobacterium lactis]|uniref:Bacteriocin n=1 Tax=Chryseobacterium lactis TaxID=1241981 RepID=A0ABN5RQN4_CHRLC|nr:bacteriocin [Chryseobacterium lactis]AZB04376.1 bacteriocin [Chryseobacterium lactis]
MKKQNLNQGKKLTKKQLKTISGGVMICTHSGRCAQIHPTCYEKQCRPGASEVCMPTSNTCTKKSFSCVEPPCWPDLEPPIQ